MRVLRKITQLRRDREILDVLDLDDRAAHSKRDPWREVRHPESTAPSPRHGDPTRTGVPGDTDLTGDGFLARSPEPDAAYPTGNHADCPKTDLRLDSLEDKLGATLSTSASDISACLLSSITSR